MINKKAQNELNELHAKFLEACENNSRAVEELKYSIAEYNMFQIVSAND